MKTREQRRKVVIPARMRGPAGWQDACILNVSERGMLLQSSAPSPRGAYVEIRRGQHVVVARVIWSQSGKFGVRAQDLLPVEALIARQDAVAGALLDAGQAERRSVPRRADDRHDHSRMRARAGEFVVMALAGTMAASLAYGAVVDSLARPLAAASRALGGASAR